MTQLQKNPDRLFELLPALYRGYLRGASSRWKVAVMRPGNAPLTALAEALRAPESLNLSEPVEAIIAWCRLGPPDAHVTSLEVHEASGTFERFEKRATF